jgi:hypothetical protein
MASSQKHWSTRSPSIQTIPQINYHPTTKLTKYKLMQYKLIIIVIIKFIILTGYYTILILNNMFNVNYQMLKYCAISIMLILISIMGQLSTWLNFIIIRNINNILLMLRKYFRCCRQTIISKSLRSKIQTPKLIKNLYYMDSTIKKEEDNRIRKLLKSLIHYMHISLIKKENLKMWFIYQWITFPMRNTQIWKKKYHNPLITIQNKKNKFPPNNLP